MKISYYLLEISYYSCLKKISTKLPPPGNPLPSPHTHTHPRKIPTQNIPTFLQFQFLKSDLLSV